LITEIMPAHISSFGSLKNIALEKGQIITTNDISTKRPGNGLSPIHWDTIIGSSAKKNYLEDEQIA
jgi:sialic acid synthase SpsE